MRACVEREWVGICGGSVDPGDVELGNRLVGLAASVVRNGRRRLAALKAHEPIDLETLKPMLVSFETCPFAVRLLLGEGADGAVELIHVADNTSVAEPAVTEFVAAGLCRLKGGSAQQVVARWRSDRMAVLVDPEEGAVWYVASPRAGRPERFDRLFGLRVHPQTTAIARCVAMASRLADAQGERACA